MSSFCLHASPEALVLLGKSIVDNPLINSRPHTRLHSSHIMASSLDLNMVKNKMWNVMQKQIYQMSIHDYRFFQNFNLAGKVQTLISFYLLNKMLRFAGIMFLIEFPN